MDALERDVFGSHEIAYECLNDIERTTNFERAINAVVNRGDQVLELGTGTGILALMAGRAGAQRVDAYEISAPMAAIARRNVAANGMGDIVGIRTGDVTTGVSAPVRPYDVVIAEMISVGLIEEQLVPALNHLIGNVALTPEVRAIPTANTTWIELVQADFTFFGFSMPTVQIEQTWQPTKIVETASGPIEVDQLDLTTALRSGRPIDPEVSRRVTIHPLRDLTVNAVRVTSESSLSSGVVSGWTQCMNSPAVIPVEPRALTQHRPVVAELRYLMGGEMPSFDFQWV